jgi:hypothetical protein
VFGGSGAAGRVAHAQVLVERDFAVAIIAVFVGTESVIVVVAVIAANNTTAGTGQRKGAVLATNSAETTETTCTFSRAATPTAAPAERAPAG